MCIHCSHCLMPPSDLVRRPHVTAMHIYMTNLAHAVLLIERENALRQGSNGKQLLLNLRKSLWTWEKAGPDKKNSDNKCLWYKGVSGVLVQNQVNQSKGMRVWGQGVSGSVSEKCRAHGHGQNHSLYSKGLEEPMAVLYEWVSTHLLTVYLWFCFKSKITKK